MKKAITTAMFFLVTAVGCSKSSTGNKNDILVVQDASSETQKQVQKKTENHFSVVDKLVVGRKNIFKADLNGDSIEDTLSVINSVSINQSMLDTITTLHPWPYYGEGAPSAELTEGSTISLFIELSLGDAGYHNYLIYDVNVPSILDADAASELLVSKIANLDKVEFKGLVGHARGDVIVLPTEAGIDTYIYWNGESFMVYEPAEQP